MFLPNTLAGVKIKVARIIQLAKEMEEVKDNKRRREDQVQYDAKILKMGRNSVSIDDMRKFLMLKPQKDKATVKSIVEVIERKLEGKLDPEDYPDLDAIMEIQNSTPEDRTIRYVDLTKDMFVPIKYKKMISNTGKEQYEVTQDNDGNMCMEKKQAKVWIKSFMQLLDHLHAYFLILIGL